MIKSIMMRWTEHLEGMRDTRNAHRLMVGNRPLGRQRYKWVDNIKMDLGD
jgi:hypothetical protein